MGHELLQEATDVFAQKFKDHLPPYFGNPDTSFGAPNTTKRRKVDEQPEDISLEANETLCRYCGEKRPKPGIGGHETRCAEKLGKTWTPRSRDSPLKDTTKSTTPTIKVVHSPPPRDDDNREPPVIHDVDPLEESKGFSTSVTHPSKGSSGHPSKDVERTLSFESPPSSTATPPPSSSTGTPPPSSTGNANLLGTDEVFPCVSLTPYRMAQMLGKHPKESREALLADYWSKMDPDGYYRVVENMKDLLADGSLEAEVRQALASSSSSVPVGSKGSPTVSYSQRVKETMAKLLHNMPPGFSSSASNTQTTNDLVHGAYKMRGRRHEGQALRRFEIQRGIEVTKEGVAVTYLPPPPCTEEEPRRYFDPEGPSNYWKLYGKLDGRIDRDTLIEVKTRMYGLGDHIPIQDALQMQTYMQMFDALKCVHLEFHPESGKLRDRTVLRNQAQWERTIKPGITTFVRDLQALLSRDPRYNAHKLFILRAKN